MQANVTLKSEPIQVACICTQWPYRATMICSLVKYWADKDKCKRQWLQQMSVEVALMLRSRAAVYLLFWKKQPPNLLELLLQKERSEILWVSWEFFEWEQEWMDKTERGDRRRNMTEERQMPGDWNKGGKVRRDWGVFNILHILELIPQNKQLQ